MIASLALGGAASADAAEVAASAPTAISVTIYRDPNRNSGPLNLRYLGGFTLVTETRAVVAPAGESRLLFEGVLDGVQPESVIISGLPDGVIEKNRDAETLSPETLIRAAIGSDITLVRTVPKTGARTSTLATVRSAGADGVVFQTADGVEAYRCSGLGESIAFRRIPKGLGSTPSLSARVRSRRPLKAVVSLSYLSRSFDWAANYVAEINASGRTLDLKGWITLANGNDAALLSASTQIVAGRLHRSPPGRDLQLDAPRVIARCWPRGTTSDPPDAASRLDASDESKAVIVTAVRRKSLMAPAPMALAAPPAPPPPPEDLGDLKLYRTQEPTTVLAHQMKQIRLIDQVGVPFERTYTLDISPFRTAFTAPATLILRVKNTLKDNLGLPLPSGKVAVLEDAGGRMLLTGEAPVHDTAVGENLELKVGVSSDIQVRQTQRGANLGGLTTLGSRPDHAESGLGSKTLQEVEISNARDVPARFELRLQINQARVALSDPPMELKDGRPFFRLIVPANGSVTVRYVLKN